MPLFRHLRQLRTVSLTVLLSYLLVIGLSVAAPLVNDRGTLTVCTGLGVKQVTASTADEPQESMPSSVDCPLCLVGHAFIPSVVQLIFQAPQSPGIVVTLVAESPPSEHQSRWQARAPPVLL